MQPANNLFQVKNTIMWLVSGGVRFWGWGQWGVVSGSFSWFRVVSDGFRSFVVLVSTFV